MAKTRKRAHTPLTDASECLKVPEVARALRLDVQLVRAAIRRGQIPVIKFGPHCWRIPRAALDTLLTNGLGSQSLVGREASTLKPSA